MSYLLRRQRHISFSQRAKTITRSIALIIITILVFCGPCKGSGASFPHAGGAAAVLRIERTATGRRACLHLRRRNQHASANLPRFHGHESPDKSNHARWRRFRGDLDSRQRRLTWLYSTLRARSSTKCLNVTALPLVVTSLTANFFQSATTNPALSGFLRMASADQICWRNNGNSADVCLSKNSSTQLFSTAISSLTSINRMFGAPCKSSQLSAGTRRR